MCLASEKLHLQKIQNFVAQEGSAIFKSDNFMAILAKKATFKVIIKIKSVIQQNCSESDD